MKTCLCSAILVGAVTAVLHAQQPAASPKSAEVPATEAAAAELRRALQFLHSLPAVRLSARATPVPPQIPEDFPIKIEFEPRPPFRLEFERRSPDCFLLRAFHGLGADVEWLVASDGKQWLRAHGLFGLHSVVPAPAGLSPFSAVVGPQRILGVASLRSLFSSSGERSALVDARLVAWLGDEKVAGIDAVHLAVRDVVIACDIWVQKGEQPWVLRLVPKPMVLDLRAPAGSAGAGDVDIEMVKWSQEVSRDAFAMTAPADSQQVGDFDAAMDEQWAQKQAAMVEREADQFERAGAAGGAGRARPGEAKAHPSVGTAAPDVEFPLLDGSKKKLADLRGKVVVLDFWATWCVPCVAGLPKVAEVVGAFADRGVVFLAVNGSEKKEVIEGFLARKKLAIPVAVGDARLGKAFGVEGIPHTVVIGADGVIRIVHVGYEPGEEKQLERELSALVGGKPAGR